MQSQLSNMLVHTFNVQEFDATVLTVLEGHTNLFEASALGLVP